MTLADRLHHGSVEQRLAAIAALLASEEITTADLDALLRCVGDERKIVQRRAAEAVAALAFRGFAIGDALRPLLEAPLGRLRWGAVFALSLIAPVPREARPILLEALGTADGDVRWAAADILVRSCESAGLDSVLCSLFASENPLQRKMAAYVLRDLQARSAEVQAAMCTALADADCGVRLAALSGMTQICVDRAAAAAAVISRLHDVELGVRRAAAATLGTLGERSPAVLDALHGAVADTDGAVRKAALRSLKLLE